MAVEVEEEEERKNERKILTDAYLERDACVRACIQHSETVSILDAYMCLSLKINAGRWSILSLISVCPDIEICMYKNISPHIASPQCQKLDR